MRTRTRFVARKSIVNGEPRWAVWRISDTLTTPIGLLPTRAQARRHAYRLNNVSRNRWRRARWLRNRSTR